MKKIVLLLLTLSGLIIAQSYPAEGPNSYQALHKKTYNLNNLANRKGFRLGFGIGIGSTNFDNNTDTGFASTFQIGYAPTNQFSINYLSNVNWSSATYNEYTETYDGTSGFSALTMNYYLNRSTNSLFFTVGLAEAGIDDEYDLAGMLGIGYAAGSFEFEVNTLIGEIHNETLSQVFITAKYMFY
jgi:hypothetical protein